MRVPLDAAARADLRQALDQARQLCASVERPSITDNDRQCARCSLAPVCLPEEVRHERQPQRDQVEHRIAENIARELLERLPKTPAEFEGFLQRGFELASNMSWDAVARDYILPGFDKALKASRLKQVI